MAAKVSSKMRTCKQCNEVMPPEYHYSRRYCNEKCRRKAEYQRLEPKIRVYQVAHRDEIRANQIKWIRANPEKVKASQLRGRDRRLKALKEWKKRNRDHINAYKRATWRKYQNPVQKARWLAANKKRVRAYKAKWAKANPGKVLAKLRRRQTAKQNALPAWLSEDQFREMAELYQTAALLTRHSDEPYQVDHIIPLLGKGVCGLHVPWNLQIMTAVANRKKRNHYVS